MLGPLLAMPSGQGLNMTLLAILKVNGANWLLVLEKNWSCGKMFLLLTRYHYWSDNITHNAKIIHMLALKCWNIMRHVVLLLSQNCRLIKRICASPLFCFGVRNWSRDWSTAITSLHFPVAAKWLIMSSNLLISDLTLRPSVSLMFFMQLQLHTGCSNLVHLDLG